MKTGIKAGEKLNSDGYQIEPKRAVKAGDSVAVFLIGGSLLSIEAANGATAKGEAKPWFTAYRDDMKASDRAGVVQAWWTENNHIGLRLSRGWSSESVSNPSTTESVSNASTISEADAAVLRRLEERRRQELKSINNP